MLGVWIYCMAKRAYNWMGITNGSLEA